MQSRTQARLHEGWLNGSRWIEKGIDFFFFYRTENLARIFRITWLVGLYLWGLYLWGGFFSWGNISLDFLDWGEVTGPRYAMLQSAARQNELPLHAASQASLRNVTDRYLSIADTPFSPQYYLLRFLSIGQFIFLDTMLFYTLGFIGLVIFFYRYKLSPWVFGVLFLLFNFNGNQTIHLAVGHTIWVGQFLMPYFVLFVFSLAERQRAGWGWIMGLALLLLTVLLQGAEHLFVWCLLFLGTMALFNLRLLKPILLGGIFSVLVSLPRLLPPALELSGITHEYLGGFASLTNLLEGLVLLRDPDTIAAVMHSKTFPLNGWEVDFYAGLAGTFLVLFFGVYLPLRRDHQKNSVPVQVLLPCLVLAVLSLGSVYGVLIQRLPIPPFTGERVTSRMFILPFLFALFLGVIYLQKWMDRTFPDGFGQKMVVPAGLLALSLVEYHDLGQHLQAWSIRYLDGLTYLYPKLAFDPAQHVISNHADPVYTAMLISGGVVALAALLFMGGMWARARRAALVKKASLVP